MINLLKLFTVRTYSINILIGINSSITLKLSIMKNVMNKSSISAYSSLIDLSKPNQKNHIRELLNLRHRFQTSRSYSLSMTMNLKRSTIKNFRSNQKRQSLNHLLSIKQNPSTTLFKKRNICFRLKKIRIPEKITSQIDHISCHIIHPQERIVNEIYPIA